MSTLRRVLLVTDELYPFTAGGIGRLIHNLILDSVRRTAPVEFHILAPADSAIQPSSVNAYFGNHVSTHLVRFANHQPKADAFEDMYPPAAAFTDCSGHRQSLDILLALKRLMYDGQAFDTIEFTDYRGWAYCALQEKHLGLDFRETEISVRIYATNGVLQHFESRPVTMEQLGEFELERKALHDADRVIAHLPSIADFTCQYYGFENSWRRAVTIEFPPAVLSQHSSSAVPEGRERNLVFSTKLQPVKRPDLFVRATATFMRVCQQFRGKAIFACHAFDRDYAAEIHAMVPPDLTDRFIFLDNGISPETREALLPGNIVVIPSIFETFCAAAYEASAAGATVILNGACPAFAEGTPFRHAENCYKFDGTVEGLASTMETAWSKPRLKLVSWNSDHPYWETPRPLRQSMKATAQASALVSVVITNFNLARYLSKAISSVTSSTYGNIEIVLVDDSSTNDADHEILRDLEAQCPSGTKALKIVRNTVNRGLAASRNIGLRMATGEYILPLDADDCISTAFIQLAVQALEGNRTFDVVVPTAAFFRTDDELASGNFSDFAIFLGDVPSLGLVANRFSCATSLLRRSLFDRYQYNESLTCYEDWDLYLRLTHGGHRFLVTNAVHFFYRNRPGSMVKTTKDLDSHLQMLGRVFETIPRPLPQAVHLFGLLAHGTEIDRLRNQFREQTSFLAECRVQLNERTSLLNYCTVLLNDRGNKLEVLKARLDSYVQFPPIRVARWLRRLVLRLPPPSMEQPLDTGECTVLRNFSAAHIPETYSLRTPVACSEHVRDGSSSELIETEQKISELQVALAKQAETLRELTATLSQMRSSRVLRLVSYYYRFRDTLLPKDSRRRKAVKFVWSGWRRRATPQQPMQIESPIDANDVPQSHFPALRPLQIFSLSGQRPRITLVTDNMNEGHLFGGVATAIIFTTLLAKKSGAALRIITRQERADEKNFRTITRLNGIDWQRNVEFLYANPADDSAEVEVGEKDRFVTTSWETTWCVKQNIGEDRIIYLLQEDERIFCPLGDEYLRCTEILSSKKTTMVVNSKLLHDHFVSQGFHNIREQGLWFEPSFSKTHFYYENSLESRKSKFLFYAAPNNPRSLCYRGLEAIDQAVKRRILDPSQWDCFLVGKDLTDLSLSQECNPKIVPQLDWSQDAALLRRMDIGLSLIYSPHPPLDLAACGAVAITNRWGLQQSLEKYSKNILCSDIDLESLVQAIADAVRLAADKPRRFTNYRHNSLLTDWTVSFDSVLGHLTEDETRVHS